ncbi:MAG: protein phosphatase 2C domain-containing protein [Candidatus Algichlamydia australiensis]|nr:protein phosphatase 2C domain-containing protein [Chlamydiales bacterium]
MIGHEVDILYHGATDKGCVRKNNEDFFGALSSHNLYVLADGMGGHNAGEIAAKEAVNYFLGSVRRTLLPKNWKREELCALLQQLYVHTNERVHEMSLRFPHFNGMGSTLTSCLFYDRFIFMGHVGDSRLYRFRDGELSRLTSDHLRASKTNKAKMVLTRAIGPSPTLFPDVKSFPVRENDQYLICSDGLTREVKNEEISIVLGSNLSPEEKCKNLILSAKEKGGNDNITIIIIQINHIRELSRQ